MATTVFYLLSRNVYINSLDNEQQKDLPSGGIGLANSGLVTELFLVDFLLNHSAIVVALLYLCRIPMVLPHTVQKTLCSGIADLTQSH